MVAQNMLYAVAVLTNDAVISTYYKLPVPLQTCLLCSEVPSNIDTMDILENEEIISVDLYIVYRFHDYFTFTYRSGSKPKVFSLYIQKYSDDPYLKLNVFFPLIFCCLIPI